MEKEFLWGVATSSYQIEGAIQEEGKGKSIWDTFCQKYPQKIEKQQTGEMACDHYHRYQEDIAIMSQLGIQAYRFSISWTRILPQGIGKVNQKGIEFYRRILKELKKRNIVPFLTLYHWDLPEALYQKGGWSHSKSPEWFANYTKIIVEELGDLVQHIITFNEPQVFIGEYVTGRGAPGIHLSRKEVLQMAHHVLLAHGRAVQEIRKINPNIQIGYAPTFSPYYPVKKEAIQEARNQNFSIQNKKDYMWNITWWSDPILLGHYPEDGIVLFEKDMPNVTKEEMKIISEPIDFYGQNLYQGIPVGGRRKNKQKTAMNWSIDPEILYWTPKFLYERYHKPIYILENGAAFEDEIATDGNIHDRERIAFLESHIQQLLKVKQEGIQIKGYFLWSLLDNFEWLQGYTKRFGIVHVDFKTQKRTIKDSGYWYQQYIKGIEDFSSEKM